MFTGKHKYEKCIKFHISLPHNVYKLNSFYPIALGSIFIVHEIGVYRKRGNNCEG